MTESKAHLRTTEFYDDEFLRAPFQKNTDAYRHLAGLVLNIHNDRVGILYPTQPNTCTRASFQRYARLIYAYDYTLLDRFVIRNLEICAENEVEKGI
jgi:hypothetical protein